MSWFRKKNNREQVKEIDHLLEKVSKEIDKHKVEKKEAETSAQQATDKLDRVINRNGFTLKIHIAAGGRYRGS